MIKQYKRYKASVIGVQRVHEDDVSRYGIVDGKELTDRFYTVRDLVEKPKKEEAPSNLAIMGRYILSPKINENEIKFKYLTFRIQVLIVKTYLKVKRICDFIFASFLLVLAFPIMMIAVLAIKYSSDGPVLFKQERPGKDCRIFTVYKFRTMRVELEKDGKSLSDMERMTKIGTFLRKTSIDELPQLINILRGEMSFIGPRPLLVQYLDFYSDIQIRRHEVTPGISGWAQVNGRNAISWEEKFELDIWYVDNICLSLDFKIFFVTIWNVLNRDGINNSSKDTMPLFSEIATRDSFTNSFIAEKR